MSSIEKYNGYNESPLGASAGDNITQSSTQDLAMSLMRRWKTVLITFIIITAAVLSVVWTTMEPQYEVAGAIRVAPILRDILSGQPDTGDISNYRNFMNTQAVMATSSHVVQRVADELSDKGIRFFEDPPEPPVQKLRHLVTGTTPGVGPVNVLKDAIASRRIRAVTAAQTELLEIKMINTDPQEAQQIVNAFINAYMAVEGSASLQEENNKLVVLENERQALMERMNSQREQIMELAQKYGDASLEQRHDMKLSRIATLLGKLTELESRRIHLESQVRLYERTEQRHDIGPEEMMRMRKEYLQSDLTIMNLTRKIANLEEDYIVATQHMAPTNPQLAVKEQVINSLTDRLKTRQQEVGDEFKSLMEERLTTQSRRQLELARTELAQAQAAEEHFRQILSEEDIETIGLGRRQLEIQSIQEKIALNKETYDAVQRRIREIELERKRPARISVAYNADIQGAEDKRVKFSMAGMLAAAVSGVGLALVKDRTDARIRTTDDIIKHAGSRVVGTTVRSSDVRLSLLPQQISDDYQSICANLGLLANEGIPRKIVVTSPGPRDGKTTFAINLGSSLAKLGRKVLLVEGDLRKPNLAKMMNLSGSSDCLQQLLAGRRFGDVLCQTHIPGLSVMTALPCDCNLIYKLITREETGKFLDNISKAFDHIIIDSPPALAVVDSLLWAKMADAVVLTSLAGQTSAPDLKEAISRFEKIGVKVLGTVLNSVSPWQSYNRYGYGYYTKMQARNVTRTTVRKRFLLLPATAAEEIN